MIRSFAHKGLALFFLTGSKAGISAHHADRLRLIPGRLDVSVQPNDMALPGFRLHPLTADRAGRWAVRVDANWRVTFRLDGTDAFDVDYEDYH